MIEQREDGSLFSLSYGRATPPIDGNALIISTLDLPTSPYISLYLPHHLDSICLYLPGNALIISTLDRVSEHPFVRQAAWALSNPMTLTVTLTPVLTLTIIVTLTLNVIAWCPTWRNPNTLTIHC